MLSNAFVGSLAFVGKLKAFLVFRDKFKPTCHFMDSRSFTIRKFM